MTPARRRKALLLVEFLFVLLPSVIVFGLMMFLIVDFSRIQRLAGEHASRMAVVDSLSEKLRADLASARNANWVAAANGAGMLSLSSLDHEKISYRFDSERVSRFVADIENNVWSAPRLQFACSSPSGESGVLLLLGLEELPPPPNSALPPRKYAKTFVLPPTSLTAAEDVP